MDAAAEFVPGAASWLMRALGSEQEPGGTKIVDVSADGEEIRPVPIDATVPWQTCVQGFEHAGTSLAIVHVASALSSQPVTVWAGLVPVVVGYLLQPVAPVVVTEDMLRTLPADWTLLFSGPGVEHIPLDAPIKVNALGRWFLLKDQFERWYPPGMVVYQHPNNMVFGVIFFESIGTNRKTNNARLGADAFPTDERNDYETYSHKRIAAETPAAGLVLQFSTPAAVSSNPVSSNPVSGGPSPGQTTLASIVPLACDPAAAGAVEARVQKIGLNGGRYRVHMISTAWFRRNLYGGWFDDGPWQFLFLATPRTIVKAKAGEDDAFGKDANPNVGGGKLVDGSRVEFMEPSESAARSMSDPEFCTRPPMMGDGPLPDTAPSGRKLTHSWPLPYYKLSPDELALANVLWRDHRYPTIVEDPPKPGQKRLLRPSATVLRSSAVRRLLLPIPTDGSDQEDDS